MDAIDRARSYGVQMNESLTSAEIAELHKVERKETVYWTDQRLARVTRLRLIGFNSREYPRWDLSYCYGELKDGTPVRVQVPFYNLNRNWAADIIAWGRKEGVYAKGLGLLDDSIVSRLYG